MSAIPQFYGTPGSEAGLVGTADTSLTAPAGTTILTAGSNGTKIEEIVAVGVGTTVAGLLNLFLHDGSTYHLFDQFDVTAVSVNTTTKSWRRSRAYDNLVLPSGWTLRAAQTVSGNNSLIKVTALANDAAAAAT